MQIVTNSAEIESRCAGVIKLNFAEIEDSVVILTEEDTDVLNTYVFVNTLIKNDKGVKCVVCGASELMKNSIGALMFNSEHYNIFESDIESIDEEYINDITDIEQTREEAEMFLDEKVLAYSTVSKKLIEKEDNDCKVGSEYIEYLKSILDSGNTDNKVNIMSVQMKDRIDKKNEEIEQLKSNLESSERNIKQLESLNKSLKDNLISANDSIVSYVTVNTAAIATKAKHILYFKEISYVRYMNTFIEAFMKILELSGVNARLIIQDVRDDRNSRYGSIPVVDDKFYGANRDKLVNSTKEFVAVSKSTAIIEDVLKLDSDILVIYDRTGTAQSLIAGDVTRFFVVGSRREFETATRFRIDPKNTFCYSEDTDDGIHIEKIPDFKSLNENSKVSKINKMVFADKSEKMEPRRVIAAVLERAHINVASLAKARRK